MHPVVIISLIFTFLFLVQSKRWLDQVKRGIVSSFKYEFTLFLFILMLLPLQWLHSFEAITMMCYGMLGGLILISIVNMKTNGSDRSQDDLRIWSGNAALLVFGTGTLTLVIHVPDSISEVGLLLGFTALIFYNMFFRFHNNPADLYFFSFLLHYSNRSGVALLRDGTPTPFSATLPL